MDLTARAGLTGTWTRGLAIGEENFIVMGSYIILLDPIIFLTRGYSINLNTSYLDIQI
jgi:hypothetical protein